LPNVRQYFYQTLDNIFIEQGNSPDKHEQDILWWSMVVEVWSNILEKKKKQPLHQWRQRLIYYRQKKYRQWTGTL